MLFGARTNCWAPPKTPLWLLDGSFALTTRFENPAIHPVCRNFHNFCENKIARPKPHEVVFSGCLLFEGFRARYVFAVGEA